ncbi:chemotaxis protein CheW [Parendozoicomonas sp. Alg238-R29]|uniref:chemotaxis protein CheW n=1 Tax=Parendozoicomonas sp. Alg238-R29 TaxID=2993446 RepID=UPI00248D9A08|nr:chemotaxis protein CheW [Parendozoicomonas sp. Alg238-R29]
MKRTETPFELLLDLDQRAREHAAGLPAQEEVRNYWSGVGFMLNGQRYVSPLEDVHEILHIPETVTDIPGAYPWVKGVANVRGRLLPLIDLSGFFGFESGPVQQSEQRALVVEQGDLYCGLVVDAVSGLQHFEVETYNSSIPVNIPENVRFCMAGSYQREAEFLVLSFRTLAKSDRFLQVSPGSAVA